MSAAENKAVFLSYASQDADAARHIAESLRAAGIEVWFDQSELVGGDAWDQKIRKQIKDCALLIPIISANTQARTEGYFRLEWRLADQRTHLMAKGRPFLLPVVIDDTRDTDAQVPDSFTEVQWTRLRPLGFGGQAPQDEDPVLAKFVARVKKLLSGDHVGAASAAIRDSSSQPIPAEAAPTRKPVRLAPAILTVVAALGALAIWQPWHSANPSPPPAVTAASTELARVRARIIPDRWQKGDFEAIAPTLDRLIETNPDEADAWALRSIINSLQVLRLIDPGTKPLETGKSAAEHAQRLARGSPLPELALGLHLTAMVSRGGDPQAARAPIDRAVAALPPDALTRFAGLVSLWLGYDFDGTERRVREWLQAEPDASYPTWIMGTLCHTTRRPADALAWAERAAADTDITGIRALCNLVDVHFYLRADLAASRAALERVPGPARSIHRVAYWRWLLAMAEGNFDAALQELGRIPEPFLLDTGFNGPKALLAGLAHQRAGRPDAAQTQFREAERLLRERLALDSDNEMLRVVLALTLASAERHAEARSELALVEPLVQGRAPNVYRGRLVVTIAQTYGALGDFGSMAGWLRKLFAEPSSVPFTPASLRLDPRFTGLIGAPEVQALLKEFARLDEPVEVKAEDRGQKTVVSAVIDLKSVAVLAFANLSDDKGNEYFSDGISEELLNVLAKVPGLTVKGRSSGFFFKGKDTPVPEIAQQLGVAYIVQGSVRKAGNRVRISAQLIRAAADEVVWSSGSLDRDLQDIFAVQDEIAGLVAQQLQLKLGVTRPARVVDPEAHRLLLEARHYWHQRGEQNFDRTEALLHRALTIDPDFAPAHAAMADLWVMRAAYRVTEGADDLSEELGSLRTSAARATELDPSLVAPIAAMAYGLLIEGRMDAAQQQFEAAVALNPNDATVRYWRALFLMESGDFDAARREFALARELDPKAWIIAQLSGQDALHLGHREEALALFRQANADRPDGFAPAVGYESLVLWQTGRTDEAVAAARAVRQSWPRQPRWQADAHAIWVLRQAGLTTEVAGYTDALFAGLPAQTYQRGFVLAALGRFDEALPYLERSPTLSLDAFASLVIFDPWRDDPRFTALIEKLHWTEPYAKAREAMKQAAP